MCDEKSGRPDPTTAAPIGCRLRVSCELYELLTSRPRKHFSQPRSAPGPRDSGPAPK